MLSHLGIRSLSLDHRAASLTLRGRVALDADGVRAALADPARPAAPALILATCNRLELLWIGSDVTAAWWRARLGPEAAALVQRRQGRAAVRHLVRVAAGLESQLLGEAEILGQLRAAYAIAREMGTVDDALELIVERAISGARRVRAESVLGTHARSVSEAAVQAAAVRTGGSLRGQTVLVVGAGEAARGALTALEALQPERLIIVNRNLVRAAKVGGQFGVRDVRPWEALPGALAESHVVICATAARAPIITPALIDTLPAPATPRCFVDLSVPANVDAELRVRADAVVFDLDDLREQRCPAAAADSVAMLAADALVEREVRRMGAAVRARRRTQAIGALHAIGDQVAAEEAARVMDELGASLSVDEQAVVQRLAQRVARRVLFPVSRYLRDGATPATPASPAATG